LVIQILLALGLTILIECGLSLVFRSRQLTYSVLLCNLLTNPLLNLLMLLTLYFWGLRFYYPLLAVLEVAVVLVEAFVIRLMMHYRTTKAILVSLLLNAASFFAGLLLWPLVWPPVAAALHLA